ncbi:hypothetical protein Q1695_006314 [Nippostrongylus brasiliensis]|nr:hypothetical protein Q1695_006314 [Nippostrongylus brasiliensis]
METLISFKRYYISEGIERTLATNHLGSFLLTGLLLDKLLAQDHPVRIVFLNTNIIGRKCELDFDDLNAESRKKYDGFEVYKQSKLAAAMFARELSERLKEAAVSMQKMPEANEQPAGGRSWTRLWLW